MEYRIGEIADLFGLSKEAVRHYERLNVIEAVRNPNNNYRFYDEETINTLRMLRSYRSLHFSLKETVSILEANEKETMMQALERKEQKLSKERDQLNHSIQLIQEQKVMLQQLDQQVKQSQITQRPGLLWLPCEHAKTKDPLYKETELNWSKHMPIVRISAQFKWEKEQITATSGLCVTAEAAAQLNITKNRYVEEILPCQAIHTVLTSNYSFIEKIDTTWIKALQELEARQQLETSNDILAMGIIRIGKTHYFDCWHPLLSF